MVGASLCSSPRDAKDKIAECEDLVKPLEIIILCPEDYKRVGFHTFPLHKHLLPYSYYHPQLSTLLWTIDDHLAWIYNSISLFILAHIYKLRLKARCLQLMRFMAEPCREKGSIKRKPIRFQQPLISQGKLVFWPVQRHALLYSLGFTGSLKQAARPLV